MQWILLQVKGRACCPRQSPIGMPSHCSLMNRDPEQLFHLTQRGQILPKDCAPGPRFTRHRSQQFFRHAGIEQFFFVFSPIRTPQPTQRQIRGFLRLFLRLFLPSSGTSATRDSSFCTPPPRRIISSCLCNSFAVLWKVPCSVPLVLNISSQPGSCLSTLSASESVIELRLHRLLVKA